jgi:hypothetical protein
MEATLVPRHGIPMQWVRFGGLRGKGLKTKLMLPINLLRASWQSLRALLKPSRMLVQMNAMLLTSLRPARNGPQLLKLLLQEPKQVDYVHCLITRLVKTLLVSLVLRRLALWIR